MIETEKRGFLLSKAWIQAVILVFLFGFFVLGFLAYRTYTGQPPIPGKVVDTSGRILFTRADIMAGQGTFLRNGLMEYGSIFGHGAYPSNVEVLWSWLQLALTSGNCRGAIRCFIGGFNSERLGQSWEGAAVCFAPTSASGNRAALR